jgi:signal transduction histidine kinase
VTAAHDRYAAKGVDLRVKILERVQVWADPDRIGQVLTNLLENALRHTPPGGTVTVSCRRVDHQVEYSVTDTGAGIAAEHLPHVFDASTARTRRGTAAMAVPASG